MSQMAMLIGFVSLAVAGPLLGQPQCGAVGERSIHTCVHRGDGPTIVLAAGAGQDSRTWSNLTQDLNAIGTVVSFDRPGLGQTPDAEGPRTPTAIALELNDLLRSLDLTEPAILVGHSMGGIHMLRYADLFPQSVLAVVLLDTPPPDFERERMNLLSVQEGEERQRALAEGRARSPSIVGRERDGAAAERWSFDNFPSVPLAVVVADGQYFGELGSQEAHRQLWIRLSERWLALSVQSRLIRAAGSGHMVHQDRAELVLDVIRRLTDVGREHQPPDKRSLLSQLR